MTTLLSVQLSSNNFSICPCACSVMKVYEGKQVSVNSFNQPDTQCKGTLPARGRKETIEVVVSFSQSVWVRNTLCAIS